jgi:hypothetical protein
MNNYQNQHGTVEQQYHGQRRQHGQEHYQQPPQHYQHPAPPPPQQRQQQQQHHQQQPHSSYQPPSNLEASLRSNRPGVHNTPRRNRANGHIVDADRQPTAGTLSGAVQFNGRSGESSDGPTYFRAVNAKTVPRSKEIQGHTGWKTNFQNEFQGAYGAPSGAALDDAAQSSDAPDWMMNATKLSPRGQVPVHKQVGRNSNDLGVQSYRQVSSRAFAGAAGAPTGAALDDAAESGDAPDWLRQMGAKEGVQRGTVPVHKQVGRNSNDLGIQTYRDISKQAFEGAAGHASGAVLDDSAESGDAPRWMRQMGANQGVQRSVHHKGGGWKTTFDEELFSGAAGRPNGIPLSDDAQSNDAPDWIKNQTKKSLRKKDIVHETGWKTDFTKDFEGRCGKPTGAVLDDSAQSGDAPEWMEVQTYLSPRGTVPCKPGRGSNDLGIQGYRPVDSEAVAVGK